MTLLFPCIGRRVELMQAFRAAAKRLGRDLRIIGADSSPTAPAFACVDEAVLTPPISDDGYIDALLSIVRAHHVTAVIPTIDTELAKLSDAREAFADENCTALIADSDVIDICGDKIRTFEFLRANAIDTPSTWTPAQLRAVKHPEFPYFIKPRFGSASVWVHKIEDQRDLDYYLHKVRDPIVQNFVDGVEHTLDVYVGLAGTPRCVVPRARLQVRGGEVSKGVVAKDPEIMAAGRKVVEALGDSVRGVVTLQCIVTADRRIRFIEINARFGGGAPLGIAAGADYPGWLLQELCGQTPEIAFDGFEDGLCMLRYDWSTFVPTDIDLNPRFDAVTRAPPEFV
jgi:carbamoyl-phosphate synthase large subunit